MTSAHPHFERCVKIPRLRGKSSGSVLGKRSSCRSFHPQTTNPSRQYDRHLSSNAIVVLENHVVRWDPALSLNVLANCHPRLPHICSKCPTTQTSMPSTGQTRRNLNLPIHHLTRSNTQVKVDSTEMRTAGIGVLLPMEQAEFLRQLLGKTPTTQASRLDSHLRSRLALRRNITV